MTGAERAIDAVRADLVTWAIMPLDPNTPPSLVGLDVADFEALADRMGQPRYRGRQIAQWVYGRAVATFDEMSDLSKGFRTELARTHRVGALEVAHVSASRDETRKVLFQLADGATVEGVLMRQDNRWSMCVSSQAGCALKCQFCMTGTLGLRRNLTAGEIVDQVLVGKRLLAEAVPDAQLTNLVFMGMGEPLLNLDNVVAALRILTSPQCVGISPRRITVSTAGVTPQIRAFGEAETGVNLALSLNATTQKMREMIMPHAERWPLEPLMNAVREFPQPRSRRVTLEYVLLAGINDTATDARRLAKLAKGLRCKVNLIPFNEAEPLPFERPAAKAVEKFKRILLSEGFTVSVRYSKGRSIAAACGQLAGSVRAAA